MPRIPDRTDWLDPDQPDVALGANAEPVDVEVEVRGGSIFLSPGQC